MVCRGRCGLSPGCLSAGRSLAGHRADALPALQANLSAVIEGDPGKNQHAVGGVDIIAAVFADRGDRLLPFDVRGLNVQAQVTPEGVTIET